jgi:glycosyltransferase involved in cell wall biosynthesis
MASKSLIPAIDIIIPVFNDGENILSVIKALNTQISSPFQILICYDFDEDTTLEALQKNGFINENVVLVKNVYSGVHGAVRTGFEVSKANAVITYMADDDYNAGIIDQMVDFYKGGSELVVPSRFINGGVFKGCRWFKKLLVTAVSWSMHAFAGIPVHDSTNGFRLFSRKLLDKVKLESRDGFTYSIELLVKCHRLGWKMTELPAKWYERKYGKSRFKIFQWAIAYLRWYFYPYETTYLRRNLP